MDSREASSSKKRRSSPAVAKKKRNLWNRRMRKSGNLIENTFYDRFNDRPPSPPSSLDNPSKEQHAPASPTSPHESLVDSYPFLLSELSLPSPSRFPKTKHSESPLSFPLMRNLRISSPIVYYLPILFPCLLVRTIQIPVPS